MHRWLVAVPGATVVAAGMTAAPLAAQAVSIPVACSETALVAAVNQANSTLAADTLTLTSGCTYRMTSAHGGSTNALPVITTSIEMVGPATITRASTQSFRIATVSGTGGLTLTTGVALTNGNVNGAGGAILNHGVVTLTGSFLRGNKATGNGAGLANIGTSAGAAAATFTGGAVTSNQSRANGGGIFNGSGSTLTTTGLAMTGNSAANADFRTSDSAQGL